MCGVTTTSPSARRLKTPSWFDPRLVVGIALVLGSVLIGATVVSRAERTYRMLAMGRDLAAGATVRAEDVTVVRVRLPDRGSGVYLDRIGDVVGRQLNRALSRGELVPAAALDSPPTLTTVSVPFAPGDAPQLGRGQRIEVWVSTKSCPSVVLLADVTVQDVRVSDATFGSRRGQDVVLSIEPPLADRVVAALAREGATIRAGVLTGPPVASANDGLPALSACPGSPGTP
jgi:hypothetical protein